MWQAEPLFDWSSVKYKTNLCISISCHSPGGIGYIVYTKANLLWRILFCETQWPRPPLFSPSWLIQWSMGEGSYITLFSPSDVTAFHRMKYGGGFLYNLVFTEWRHCVSQNEAWGMGCYITLFSPSDVTAFDRMKYGGGFLYNLVFTEWRHCVSQNEVWGVGCYITLFSPSDVTAFHRMMYGGGGAI